MKIRFVLALVCFSLLTLPALAQTDRGTLTGTVSDATGAVVPGVSIEAKNAQTGATYQAGSSETGNYTLAQLPAGTYEVSATLPGFRKFVRTGVIVSVATVLRIDVTLEVGTAGESVTVEAASPLLKTESGEVSHNITTDQLNDLPVLTLSQSVGQASSLTKRRPLGVVVGRGSQCSTSCPAAVHPRASIASTVSVPPWAWCGYACRMRTLSNNDSR